MVNEIQQSTVPIVVASPPEVTSQATGQEDLSTDFTGAARREGPSDDSHVELGNPPIEPDYGHVRLLSDSSQVYRMAGIADSGVVPDDRLWDGDFATVRPWSSAGDQSPQVHAEFEVHANVPARVRITTNQSFTSHQLISRQIPAGYSRNAAIAVQQPHAAHVAAGVGDVREKRLLTENRPNVASTATAKPAEDPLAKHIREKLLPDWSRAAEEEGDTACDEFYASTVQRSLDSAEKQIHATYQDGFVSTLGELPEAQRLKALTRLLAQEKGDAKGAVKKQLSTVVEAIPGHHKLALVDVLSAHGIKI